MACFADAEAHRPAYFECQNHTKVNGACAPMRVPAGPRYGDAAETLGYEFHRLPSCPVRSVWPGTLAVINNPVFTAGLHASGPLYGGGVMRQPSNMTVFIRVARAEIRRVAALRAEAKPRKK